MSTAEIRKPDLFEWVDAVTMTKTDLFNDPYIDTSSYDPFMVCRALGNNIKSVEYADLAQQYALPKDLHFQLLRHLIPQGNYRATWPKKPPVDEDVELLQEYYQCGAQRAAYYKKLLKRDQIEEIKARMFKGGRVK